MHLFPREKGDAIGDKFELVGKSPGEHDDELTKVLKNNVPIMIKNNIARLKAEWYKGGFLKAEHLEDIDDVNILHVDEKIMVALPDYPVCKGHMVLYSQDEEHDFEKMDDDAVTHLMHSASLCATAAFESLKAHATNIIVKSGKSDDNLAGLLEVHVFPRFAEDGLDVMPAPMQEKPNLDEVLSKIKDKTFEIEYRMKNRGGKKEKEVVDLDANKVVMSEEQPVNTPSDEIRAAIERVRKS
jgi:diadenosine tetraphosphate (Ap4A) HIT family hydrolase